MGTALVFLLVLALCGFIAYIGDLLGRRLGKKRLTVFGLRPKHTAILLTIVTGVVIASTTLGLALLIVPGFSKVVTQGERMLAINSRLTDENDGLQKQNDTLRRDTAEEKKRNVQLSGQNSNLDEKNRELQKANETIAAQNTSLTKTNQSLAAGNKALTVDNKTLTVANNNLLTQRKGLENSVRTLSQERAEYRASHYLFRAREELVRRPFPPNPPLEVVRAAIRNLDFEVRNRAAVSMSDRGKKTDPKDIQTQLVPPPGLSAPQERSSLESWLAHRAVGIKNTPILLRAIAWQNAIEGRPIAFYIDPFPNPRVFGKGDVIATCQLDGRIPRGQIFQELVYFLRRQVHGRATRPPFSMLSTSEGLGDVSYEHLFNTAERVALTPGIVRVEATTTTDVARSGPLNIALEVKPGEF